MDIHWLETRHVPAREMDFGLEMNLSVVSLSSIFDIYSVLLHCAWSLVSDQVHKQVGRFKAVYCNPPFYLQVILYTT